MSGGEKKKLQYDAWVERQPFNARPDFLRMNFEDIDKGFQECEDILSRVNLNIGFESKINTMYEIVEGTTKLIRYIDGLPWDIGSLMDDPLKKNFNLHATESISRIHAEDISTNNTIGVKKFSAGQAGTPYGYGQYGAKSVEETVVEKVKFEDFMDENTTGGEYRKKFADLFKADYEGMVKAKEFGEDSGVENYDDYVGVLVKQGEFDHKMDQPFKQFISGLLDLTIIKPLIEISTGTEMITNEDLTDTDKLYKGIGAIIDISTLGYAMVARKAVGGVISASRVFGLEVASNVAAYTTAYAGGKLDLPVAITMLLTLAVGVKVSKQGSQYVVKSKTGEVLGEIAGEAGDKSLFNITETLLKNGDAKTVGSVLDTFDIKSMSKEEISSLSDTLAKSGLTKVEIEQFQKVLLKNIEVPAVPDIIKAAEEAKALEIAKALEVAKAAEIAKIAKIAEEAKALEIAKIAEVAKAAEIAKIAKIAEEAKALEIAKIAEVAKAAEIAKIAKIAEEAKILEIAKIAEVAKAAEIAKIAKITEEAKILEIAKIAEAAKAAEIAKIAKVAKDADDAKKAALVTKEVSDGIEDSIKGIKIIDGKVGGKIPIEKYQELRILSIQNKSADTMILGKYRPTISVDGTENWKIPGPDSYNTLAKNDGNMYFDMGSAYDEAMKKYKLSYQEMFDYFNVPALDDAVSTGKIIKFSHNPELAAYRGSFTELEWKYFQDKCDYLYLREEGGFWYGEK